MDRAGQCLCGAVHFVIRDANPEFGVCHCKMCQRWSGAALIALDVPKDTVSFEGEENIARYQSSEWAERAWCQKCGSHLWYQVTADGPYSGVYSIPYGLLNDTKGLKINREIYVDEQADCLAIAGDRERLNTEQTLALFGLDG